MVVAVFKLVVKVCPIDFEGGWGCDFRWLLWNLRWSLFILWRVQLFWFCFNSLLVTLQKGKVVFISSTENLEGYNNSPEFIIHTVFVVTNSWGCQSIITLHLWLPPIAFTYCNIQTRSTLVYYWTAQNVKCNLFAEYYTLKVMQRRRIVYSNALVFILDLSISESEFLIIIG